MSAKKLIPWAFVLAIGLIIFALWRIDFFSKSFQKKVSSPEDLSRLTENLQLKLEAISKSDHALGNPTAEVQIIEYADTTCNHCAEMQQILADVLATPVKEGRVVWVYRNFLSDQKNNLETKYLECVAKISGNNAFWSYLEELFSNSAKDKTENFLQAKSEGLGVDKVALNECVISTYPTDKIEKDMTGGIAAGVIGTPYVFVIDKEGDTNQIVGLQPRISIEAIINQALGSK